LLIDPLEPLSVILKLMLAAVSVLLHLAYLAQHFLQSRYPQARVGMSSVHAPDPRKQRYASGSREGN
jgi:hypothetical protein